MITQSEIIAQPWVRRFIALIAITGFLFALDVGFFPSTNHLSDFAGYYTASSIVAHRDSISRMYQDDWFKGQVKYLGLHDTMMVMYVNPPPASLVMLPVVWLQPDQAKLVWNILNVVLMFIIWYAGIQLFEIPSRSGYRILFFGILASTLPFLRNLQRGQIYIVMLFLVLLLWKGFKENNNVLTGITLALMLLLKYFGWMFLLLLIVQRRWKALVITSCCFLIGSALTMLVVGVHTYVTHIERLIASFTTMDAAITGLPCMPALFGGLFIYHPLWNQNPVVDAAWLAVLLTFSSLVSMLFMTLRKQSSNNNCVYDFSAILVLSVIFTPLAAEHHYIFLSLPIFALLLHSGRETALGTKVIVLLLIVYVALGWYPLTPAYLLNGWSKIFSFTRLGGGILAWIFLVTFERSFSLRANDQLS